MTNYYIIMLPKHRKDKTYAYGPYDNATEVIEEYESRVEMYSDTFDPHSHRRCSTPG